MITLEKIKDLLTKKDLEGVRMGLKKEGFRHTDFDCRQEFDYNKIAKAYTDLEKLTFQDKKKDLEYRIELFHGAKEYDGYDFINVHILRLHTGRMEITVPWKRLLYTNAPWNTEYMRSLAQVVPCDGCKKSYFKKDLVDLEGKLLCGRCILKEMEELLK